MTKRSWDQKAAREIQRETDCSYQAALHWVRGKGQIMLNNLVAEAQAAGEKRKCIPTVIAAGVEFFS